MELINNTTKTLKDDLSVEIKQGSKLFVQRQIVVDSVGYTPINNFTAVELGCEKGNVISNTIVSERRGVLFWKN